VWSSWAGGSVGVRSQNNKEVIVQKIRLWEITGNREPVEIETSPISFERQLEDWLARDISILDPDLLVIGKQVRTDSGGAIDLLCLDSAGNTVVVELKRGLTPREVTAQALTMPPG
jgi:RecB family endonuclease NucS